MTAAPDGGRQGEHAQIPFTCRAACGAGASRDVTRASTLDNVPGNAQIMCFTIVFLITCALLQNQAGEVTTQTTMRIMRAHLRRALLDRLPSDCVQYGKLAQFAVPAAKPGEPVQLSFADGSTAECDLLVVADGANSKLRTALLPNERGRYAGFCLLYVSPPPPPPPGSFPLGSHASCHSISLRSGPVLRELLLGLGICSAVEEQHAGDVEGS